MNDKEFEKLLKGKESTDIDSFVKDNLSEAQAKKLNDILSDKEKLNNILNSEKAKTIINKFFKKE